MRPWPLLTQQATTIDRERLDAFKVELLALGLKYDMEIWRFQAQEDHGRDLPHIQIECIQYPLQEKSDS